MRDGVVEIVSETIIALAQGNSYVEQTCVYACGAYYNLSRHTANSREMRQAFIDCHASEVFKAMNGNTGKPSLYAALVSAYLNTTKTVRMGISVLSSGVQNQRLVECLEAAMQGYGYMGGGWSVEEVLGGISGLLVTEMNRESLTQSGLVRLLLQLLDMNEGAAFYVLLHATSNAYYVQWRRRKFVFIAFFDFTCVKTSTIMFFLIS